MKNLEQHIGRKVKGVPFVSEQYRMISFAYGMNECIGRGGVIRDYHENNNSFRIEFGTCVIESWHYPVEVILPQLEGELIGYMINDDEKYTKIIAGLAGLSVEDLLKLNEEGVNFTPYSHIENIVTEYDLLDKCTPVYKPVEVKLPKINGYEGEDKGEYLQYGCAKLLKSWFDRSNNRNITSMTLDSGVIINKEQINKIQEYLLFKRK